MKRLPGTTGVILAVGACASIAPVVDAGVGRTEMSLFDDVSQRAEGGDNTSQNLLGYLLFFGEHAPLDRGRSANWFSRAAEGGSAAAMANLALMYYLGVGVRQDLLRAEEYLEMARADSALPGYAFASLEALAYTSCAPPVQHGNTGEQVFEKFCAGCHGWNGIATYRKSPSFALGERLDKTDAELLTSIVGGHHDMPAWGDMIPEEWLAETLPVIRSFEAEFRGGLLHTLREPPERYFRFGAVGSQYSRSPHEASLANGGGAPANPNFCDGSVTFVEGGPMRPRLSMAGLTLALAVGANQGAAVQPTIVPDSLPPGVTARMVRQGKEIFEGRGLCHTCHGAQAGGIFDPDLTNPGWWYAEGSYLAIVRQILTGVPEDQSTSGVAMPPLGGSNISEDDVQAVAAFVWKVSHPVASDSLPPGVTEDLVARGDRIFHGPGRCFTCHGDDAQGALGPNLTDDEWLHVKGSYLTILQQVLVGVPQERSQTGIEMPPRGGAPLSDPEIQAVAAYVWALSRGSGGSSSLSGPGG